jgi:hypothetical protein
MIIKHDIGTSIELKAPGRELPLWRYTYGGLPKPCFHPVCTPSGHCLTHFQPHDHVWHRGLWFTIKYINGENFWEEEPESSARPDGTIGHGTQRTLEPPSIAHAGDAMTIRSQQVWERPYREGVVFTEERAIRYEPLSPSAYAFDLRFALTAQAGLLLDRTPFTTWGGYSGLIVRGTRNWQETKLLFADGTTSDRPTPYHSLWCDLSGKFDGGRDVWGGIAMFDHPSNVRHPVGWYGATGPGHYFNAAFLFEETMNVAAGETLAFTYRVVVHDGVWPVDALQSAYDAYVRGSEGVVH